MQGANCENGVRKARATAIRLSRKVTLKEVHVQCMWKHGQTPAAAAMTKAAAIAMVLIRRPSSGVCGRYPTQPPTPTTNREPPTTKYQLPTTSSNQRNCKSPAISNHQPRVGILQGGSRGGKNRWALNARHGCSRMFVDVHRCSRMFTDVHGCSRMFMDVHGRTELHVEVCVVVGYELTAAASPSSCQTASTCPNCDAALGCA